MILQGKVLQIKTVDQPAVGLVRPTPGTGQTSIPDRSDRPEQLVKPVEPSAESTAKTTAPVLASCVDEAPPAPLAKEDKELEDYEASQSAAIWKLILCTCLRITS